MGDGDEYRCFIGGLSWSTTDESLKDAFKKFGHLVEAKVKKLSKVHELKDYYFQFDVYLAFMVVIDKFSGKSRGFGFVSFDDKKSMEEAIEAMHNMDLDGRTITVDKAQPGGGRDRDGDRDRDRGRDSRGGGGDRDRDRGRDSRGGGGGDCYKCGKPGHFARECPSGDGGGRGGKYGGRDDRYDGGGGGGGRYASDRDGDRRSSHGSRDGGSRSGSGSDRYSRDRSGPYDRPSGGSFR